MKYILTIIQILLIHSLSAQRFINGSFENNRATSDQINLSNDALNAMLQGVTAFGSYGDVDIIKSAAYGSGGAQDKSWYIALTGGGTDIVALELSSSIKSGKKYKISFYDRKDSGHNTFPIQIGLSNNNKSFGTVVFTSNETPTTNFWKKRTFSFTAPIEGKFITVQMSGGNISDWVNIDNFVLDDSTSKEIIPIVVKDPSKDSIIVTIIEPIKKVDSLMYEPIENVKFNHNRLKGRKIKICETIVIDESAVKIFLWDKNREDGDVVSIYFNGKLIAENLAVTKTKKEITINLQNGSNLIVMHAINLGRIPPNTAAIGTNQTKRKFTTLVSDLRKSGALEIIYNPDGLAFK